jgi:ketosteroid isomerase-like protein
MSEENVEIVRRLFPGPMDMVAAVAQPDVLRPVFEPLVHPDFEAVFVRGQPPPSGGARNPDGSGRPTASGVDGFLAAFRDWLSAWDTWVATATDFLDVDENRVLVLMDVQARSKRHQVEMPISGANLFTLSDGRVARVELFLDRPQALKAAGIQE